MKDSNKRRTIRLSKIDGGVFHYQNQDSAQPFKFDNRGKRS